jgi:tRNA(His) 5'-end guanylyltransferase
MLDYFDFFKGVLYVSLDDRMKNLTNKYNTKCHCYKPHVITIKSKQILSYMKKISRSKMSFKEKQMEIETLNGTIIEICKKMYMKYDPTLIYYFNNEINIVFFYKSNGNYMFDGNINNILTLLVSDITLEMNKIKSNLKDIMFTGKFIEFDKDYEILNYLIWRQMNCKRNTLSLFYKCMHPNKSIDNIKTEDMKRNLYKMNINIDNFLTGNIIKKILYYKSIPNEKVYSFENTTDDQCIITRKSLLVNNILFSDNFKENFQKYIKNKVL